MRSVLTAFWALAVSAGPIFAQEIDLQAVADTILTETGSPGAAIAVMDADGFREAVAGVRIAGSEAAIEPGDLWHLGSDTKAMTATLAARLVERGEIDWDATISQALGDQGFEIAPEFQDARLVDLLSHRSGLASSIGLFKTLQLVGADADRDVVADRRTYAATVLTAKPGGPRGEFLYSNAGYVVAALMLETAGGAPYEALMAREVFAPLGMETAGWGPPGEAGAADQPRGHSKGMFGGLKAAEPGAKADNPPASNSAGRAHMSFEDLARFLKAHLDGAAGDESYLSAESWSRLHTPPAGGSYALGWGARKSGVLVHSGSNTLWYVVMAIDPNTGVGAMAGVNDGRLDVVDQPVGDAVRQFVSF
ncbi:MAG: serine hydrolase domain-containing protein [Pseudomonadota bacterium]